MATSDRYIRVFFTRPDTRQNAFVGTLTPDGANGSVFEYTPEYDGPPLDPIELDYRTDGALTFEVSWQRGGLPDVFVETLPSGFGYKALVASYPEYQRLNHLERLFLLGSRHYGPLRFLAVGDMSPESPFRGRQSLEHARLKSNELEEHGKPILHAFNQYPMTYSAGDRRKCEWGRMDTGQRYIAKFNSSTDPWNMARVELATVYTEQAAGIQVPNTYVVRAEQQTDVLCSSRYNSMPLTDEERVTQEADKNRTHHNKLFWYMTRSIASLSGISTRGDPRRRHPNKPVPDFQRIVDILNRVSAAPLIDKEELYRRMCFHLAVSNVDNHLGNYEMVLLAEGWRLAPSFDVVPFAGPYREAHFCTEFMGSPRPAYDRALALKAAEVFGLHPSLTVNLARRVAKAVLNFDAYAKAAELSPENTAKVWNAIPRDELQEFVATTRD